MQQHSILRLQKLPAFRVVHIIVSILLVASFTTVSASRTPKSFLPRMAPKSASNNHSSVLNELKETIREQSKEIDALKQQLKLPKKSDAAAVGHAAGHGGGEASEEDIANYLEQSFYQISIRRVFWLFIFLVSLSMTAVIMERFEHTLERQIELAYFVPMLAGHGGNTGGQAVGTVLSALSAGKIKSHDAAKVILKEAMAGIMSGFILGFMVAPIAHYIMGISKHVSTVLFFTMPLVSTIAATLGAVIPFSCLLIRLDPSVIAAPAMTSFVDVTGLISYFMIANYIFGLFGIEL